MKAIITGFSNITSEGVTLHLNRRTTLKNGSVSSKTFWVSWDRIGRYLFDDYTEESGVTERNALREAIKQEEQDNF